MQYKNKEFTNLSNRGNELNHTMKKTSLIGISRLRLTTDGHGVTTLVAFHGCPLHCKYCLNPQCLREDANTLKLSAEQIFQVLKKEELYFIATGGDATFGGGEPLLQADFIKEVLELGAKKWHTTIETSLNVPLENLKVVFPYIDEYFVDIKDMDTTIYKRYTGKDNDLVKTNLKWLIAMGKADHILCRIPLIPGFNNKEHQQRSVSILKQWGINRFDKITYVTEIKK